MARNKYFEDELNYLRELGGVFAKRNPNLAKYLGEEGNDPDVERLFEGFAFLTGRIREKLDSEHPEFTHSMLETLWPNYLRPVPSMSMLQFTPRLHVLSESKLVKRGTEVQSVDIDGTACLFRTCYDVKVAPLSISDVVLQEKADSTNIDITFKLDPGIDCSAINLSSMQVYLHDDRKIPISNSVYLCLFRYLKDIDIKIEKVDGELTYLRNCPLEMVRPLGFSESESLLPNAHSTYSGFRLVQEFFQYQQKFRFIELCGLDKIWELGEVSAFTITFKFSKLLVDSLSKENFKLFCTPIVNLFEYDGTPIRVDHKKVEYLLRPGSNNLDHFSLFSVDQVKSKSKGTAEIREYEPYEAYQHWGEQVGKGASGFYKLRRESSAISDDFDYYLYLSHSGHDEMMEEIVSTRLTCTNGKLADNFRPGQIKFDSDNSPDFATFSNIENSTNSLTAPSSTALDWAMLSKLSANYDATSSLSSIKNLIKFFDTSASSDRQKQRVNQSMREGIESIESETKTMLVKGVPVSGVKTTLTLRESKFGASGVNGEANMFLFASVLNQYFTKHARINSFHTLEVVGIETGETYTWPFAKGFRSIN